MSTTTSPEVTTVQTENFKGHPLLVLPDPKNPRFPLKLGMKKCQIVLAHIKDIEQFIKSNGKVSTPLTPDEMAKAMAGWTPEQIKEAFDKVAGGAA